MAGWLALAFCGIGAGSDPPKTPVVVTTDCGVGVDDEWALAHLALSPRFDLRGVVTTHAPSLKPPAAETSARAARDLFAGLRLARPPEVVAGSSLALDDRAAPRPNPGVDLLLRASRDGTAGRRVVVLVLGAATDVASALLTDPTFADRVEVVAMGFARWPEGGDPWNAKNDVRAWQVLLGSRVPIVVGDVAVGDRDLTMPAATARRRLDPSGARGRLLTGYLEDWLKKKARPPGDAVIWDEVTVAHLLGFTAFEVRPRPVLRDDSTFDHARPNGTITWIIRVDADALWGDLARVLRDSP